MLVQFALRVKWVTEFYGKRIKDGFAGILFFVMVVRILLLVCMGVWLFFCGGDIRIR
jgi:hypothetical protein